MRKRGRESRTAVCSSTGMLTSPNAREPFHSARAMGVLYCKYQTPTSNSRLSLAEIGSRLLGVGRSLGLGSCPGTRPKVALSLDPVVEVRTAGTPPAEIAVVGGFGDFIVRRV